MGVRDHTSVLVIGAGIAGCITALRLADQNISVTIVASGAEEDDANSWLAQGGIIYRSSDPHDSEALEKDIFIAGHYYNNPEAVRFLAEKGPSSVEEILIKYLGVPFDRLSSSASPVQQGEWDLTREGGHSTFRILHCADHTGCTIMDYLLKAVKKHPCIDFRTGHTAIDLLTSHHHTTGMRYRYLLENHCLGAYVLREQTKEVLTLLADVTVLATGGIGQVYLHTTNTNSATGAGIAMASRAFVRLENLEFVQFHPTSLFHMEARRFLVTEALRGEGAILLNGKGERFMERYDARLELAPRDIVAQSIAQELLSSGEPCVFLDAREVKHDLVERFPTVFHACLERGFDMRRQPIPVVPAAHYFCGGILTDTHARTSLNRLYSVGECSCTGVHGANRLASTSLLEGVLYSHAAAEDIAKKLFESDASLNEMHSSVIDWLAMGDEHNDDPALIAQDWASIRHTMWNYVGINRSELRLARALEDLRDLSRRIHDFYKSTPPSKAIIDLFHGCQTAYLITQAALRNEVKLGCHNRT